MNDTEQTTAPEAIEDNSPSQPYGHIKSYVHRKGHFSEGQKRAYETLLPQFGVAYEKQLKSVTDWADIFGNDYPIVLEIGCGMGETTAKIAAQNPNINYIGVEVFTAGVGALLKRIAEYGLTNLRVIQHDAVEIIRDMIAHGTLDGIHIYFPDPWHKARHNKRRIVQAPFAELVKSKLKLGGVFHMATDWEPYAEHMLEVMSSLDGYKNQSANNDYVPRPESRPVTKFEQRGHRLGHGVWDLMFERVK